MNVLICDDHRLFADSLTTVLRHEGFDVVGVVDSPDRAVEVVGSLAVDVCLMDVTFPDGDTGLLAARVIRERSPHTSVLMLTSRTDRATASAALHAGAQGIVHKVQPVQAICQALTRLAAGEVVVDPRFTDGQVVYADPEAQREARLAGYLTAREREVLELLVAGLRTETIAEQLHIGVTTARGHVQSILTKLQVHTRVKAVAFAIRNGLVSTGRPPSRPFNRFVPPSA